MSRADAVLIDNEPRIRVTTDHRTPLDEEARAAALAEVVRRKEMEHQEHQRQLHIDEMGAAEATFNLNDRPPIFEMVINDEIRSREEILANAATDASALIAKYHTQCFSQPGDGSDMLDTTSMINKALTVINKTWAEVLNLDAKSVSILFQDKVEEVQFAIMHVQHDDGMPKETKCAVFAAARAVETMFASMDMMLCNMLSVAKCAQTSLSNGFSSDTKASWRYMEDPIKINDKGEPVEVKQNNIQALYKIVLEEAARLDYARYKDGFMRRIVTADGGVTTAWEKVCTFEQFVYGLTRHPDGQIQSLTSKSSSIMDDVAKMLSKKMEAHIPWIKPDRHVFSFRNGVYLAKDELFIPYVRTGPPIKPDGSPCPTACKHHDCVLDRSWLSDQTEDWFNIPTPLVDHIMDTQELRPAVKRWYYAMLGRALYDLGELDNWQVFLFIKGMGDTGKSTLLKFVSSFYNFEDVGVLADNIEEKFGASMLVDKFVVIGDDLGEKLTLNQSLFQNLCSGNVVSLPRKNNGTNVMMWKTQFLLSGNVLPGYTDNSGSFSRRLLIIHYSKSPQRIDPSLPERLKAETAAMIIKANRAYRNTVRRVEAAANDPVNKRGLWNLLPEEFLAQRRNVTQCANTIMNFFGSGKLVFGKSLYMPRDLFVQQYKMHCQSVGMQMSRFDPAHYEGPFATRDLTMGQVKSNRLYPRGDNGNMVFDIYIDGIDLATADAIAESARDITEAAAVAAEIASQYATDRISRNTITMSRPIEASGRGSRYKRALPATAAAIPTQAPTTDTAVEPPRKRVIVSFSRAPPPHLAGNTQPQAAAATTTTQGGDTPQAAPNR